MSLIAWLLIGFTEISAQVINNVTITEIRKANQTKQRLDSCQASGNILAEDRNKWIDSTFIERKKNQKLLSQNDKITRKRDNWRIVSGVLLIVSTVELIIKTKF